VVWRYVTGIFLAATLELFYALMGMIAFISMRETLLPLMREKVSLEHLVCEQ